MVPLFSATSDPGYAHFSILLPNKFSEAGKDPKFEHFITLDFQF